MPFTSDLCEKCTKINRWFNNNNEKSENSWKFFIGLKSRFFCLSFASRCQCMFGFARKNNLTNQSGNYVTASTICGLCIRCLQTIKLHRMRSLERCARIKHDVIITDAIKIDNRWQWGKHYWRPLIVDSNGSFFFSKRSRKNECKFVCWAPWFASFACARCTKSKKCLFFFQERCFMYSFYWIRTIINVNIRVIGSVVHR